MCTDLNDRQLDGTRSQRNTDRAARRAVDRYVTRTTCCNVARTAQFAPLSRCYSTCFTLQLTQKYIRCTDNMQQCPNVCCTVYPYICVHRVPAGHQWTPIYLQLSSYIAYALLLALMSMFLCIYWAQKYQWQIRSSIRASHSADGARYSHSLPDCLIDTGCVISILTWSAYSFCYIVTYRFIYCTSRICRS